MDYKILIKAVQQSAGSEDAKLSITYGGTTVVDSVAITATDSTSPQTVVFEITGAPASGASTDVDLVCTLDNDYYVDASTDRRITLQELYYTDKADGSNYKRWNRTTGVWDTISTFDDTTMIQGEVYSISGNDQPSDFTARDHVTIFSDPVTCNVKLTETSGESGDYPASSENPR